MTWIIVLLVIGLIIQSVRVSDLKEDLWVQKWITECKMRDIETLEETIKFYQKRLSTRYPNSPGEEKFVN